MQESCVILGSQGSACIMDCIAVAFRGLHWNGFWCFDLRVTWKLSKTVKSRHDFLFASGYFQLCWSSFTWSLRCWVPLWRKPGSLKTTALLLDCWSFYFYFPFYYYILWDWTLCSQDYHELCSGGWPGSGFYLASQCLSLQLALGLSWLLKPLHLFPLLLYSVLLSLPNPLTNMLKI